MSGLRALLGLARGDFRERTRRLPYLLTLGAVGYLAYTVHAGWWTVRLGRYFAEASPGWTGALVAVVTSVPLSLFGFYVVRGTVERDRRTRVGPILAATPTTRLRYAASKFVSNLAVLGSMLLLLVGLALAIAIHRAGGLTPGGIWAVTAPSLLLTAPMLAGLAGLAVCFDSLPGLRGVAGNVLFFFLWAATLTFSGFDDAAAPWVDVTGMTLVRDAMGQSLHAVHPGASPEGISIQISARSVEPAGRFPWPGLAWSSGNLARRLYWPGLGLALTGIGAVALRLFDPFGDPSPSDVDETEAGTSDAARTETGGSLAAAGGTLSAPSSAGVALGFLRTVRGEMRLFLGGHAIWWYLAVAGVNVAAVAVPADATATVLMLAWLLPVGAWSSLGCRERLRGTEGLLFSAPSPRARQLPAQWAAGIGLAAVAGAVPLARLAASDPSALAAPAAGALFVPALALALGAWTGKRRTFQVAYLVLWYLGPANEIAALDFVGVTGEAGGAGSPSFFFAAAAGLLALAWLGRSRRLRTA